MGYRPTIYGIGYLGEGKYKPSNNGEITHCYRVWRAIIQRCYDEKFHKRQPTYKDCRVSEEWLNFQNFAKWYEENYYEIEGEKMQLDKDILIKGNKIYSPSTCIFVPSKINVLFTKANRIRGELPIGVYFDKEKNKYRSQCYINNKKVRLGRYKTIEEAFLVYKNFKENHIKEIAEYYRDYIPNELYQAMINYEVEITD